MNIGSLQGLGVLSGCAARSRREGARGACGLVDACAAEQQQTGGGAERLACTEVRPTARGRLPLDWCVLV